MRRDSACFVRKQDSLACKWFFTRIKPETTRVEASGKSGRALHQMILCSNTDCDSPPLPPLCPKASVGNINIHSGSIPLSLKRHFKLFPSSPHQVQAHFTCAVHQTKGRNEEGSLWGDPPLYVYLLD